MVDRRACADTLFVLASALLLVVGASAAGAEPRLVDAAKNQDAEQVRTLLDRHADVNVRSEDGSTALLWAAHWNDLATAELLVRAGADVNAANDLRMTPLVQACTNGSGSLVALLLNAGAHPNTPVATGETPLMTCARSGDVAAVRLLLGRGADVNAAEPTQHQTALMWAAAERHVDVVRTLIEARANLTAQTTLGFTALHFAARVGDVATTELLLKAGVDVNIRAKRDSVPVRGAAAGGAGFTTRGSSFPAAPRCLLPQSEAMFRLLCSCSSTAPTPTTTRLGLRRLHWAAGTWENGLANPVYGFVDPIGGIPDREAKLQLIKSLLAHGANPDLQMTVRPPTFGGTGTGGYNDAYGATPFIVAANAADVEVMRMLVAAGADPHLLTGTKSNALLAATGLNRGIGEIIDDEERALAAVRFLLDLGVNPKAVTTYNENALFGPGYRN
jgi:ankyrin repeat protein